MRTERRRPADSSFKMERFTEPPLKVDRTRKALSTAPAPPAKKFSTALALASPAPVRGALPRALRQANSMAPRTAEANLVTPEQAPYSATRYSRANPRPFGSASAMHLPRPNKGQLGRQAAPEGQKDPRDRGILTVS